MAFPTETILLAGTKCLVGPLQSGDNRVPEEYTITNGATPATVTVGGAGTLTVTATTVFLQEGTELSFGGTKIRLTADVAAGATSIPYVGVTAGTIAASATATTKALLRIFGGSSADIQYQDNEVSTRSFEFGLFDDARKVTVGANIAWQGTYRKGDRAFDTLILQKANSADEVYIEFEYPDGSVFKGAAFIMNLQLSGQLDNIRQVSWTFRIVGEFSFTPGVTYA